MKASRFKLVDKLMRYARGKSPWVLHLDTGGCLPGDTELITENGEFVRMDELSDIHVPFDHRKFVQTGIYGKRILSVGSLEGKMQKASFAHRIKAPEELVEIESSTGKILRLTEDHDVLVDTEKGQEWREAGKLKKGDFLVSVREIKIKDNALMISTCFPGHILAYLPQNEKREIKSSLKKEFRSLKKASRMLNIDYYRLVDNNKALEFRELNRIIDCLGINKEELYGKISTVSHRGFIYNIPRKNPDKDLLYSLGLLASDGYISVTKNKTHSTYMISFSNKEKELIKEFIRCVKEWFPEKKVLFEKNLKIKGLYTAYMYSPAYVFLAERFGLRTSKKRNTNFRSIFQLDKKLISSFLAGYFDGDGGISIEYDEKRRSPKICLTITTSEKDTAHILNLLMKRLSIASRIDKTWNESSFGKRMLYRVRVTNHSDILNFIRHIPIKHPKKKERFFRVKRELQKKLKQQSSIDMAPLECHQILESIRKKYRLKKRQLCGNRDISNLYKMKQRRVSKFIMKIYLSEIKKNVKEDALIKKLEYLLSNKYYLNPVKKVRRIKYNKPWVYNVTVEESNSYVPNGDFVVKNCNGCSIEVFAVLSPRFDVERFGGVAKSNPRHTDILLIDGAMTKKIASRVKRIYDQTPDPKVVVAVGACAISKGIFHDAYNISGPLDNVIPVDVYVPGCPPRPDAILLGMVKAIDALMKK